MRAGVRSSSQCCLPWSLCGEVLLLPLCAEWDGATPGALSWEKNNMEHLIPVFLQNFLPPMLLTSSFPSLFRWIKEITCLAQNQKCPWGLFTSLQLFPLVHQWKWGRKTCVWLGLNTTFPSSPLHLHQLVQVPSSPWKGPCCPLCLERVNALKLAKKWMGVVWVSGAN